MNVNWTYGDDLKIIQRGREGGREGGRERGR